MKILLTGGNGMVGKNILEHAAAASHTMLAPSSAELNLLDGAAVAAWLAAHRPDMVIHSAGVVGGIQANMANPVKFLVDNMQMGLNLITAARAAGVRQLMNLSSSCMYPRAAANPLAEELILMGELEPTNEGYALAKIASTRLCEYIRKEEPALLYKTVIPCNIYGRHDKFDPRHSHMIPAVIKKIVDAKLAGQAAIDIWGDGTARREFMFAGDLADFVFYAVARFDAMPQNINVGLGHDYTINEYYAAVARTVGFDGAFEHDLSKPVGMKQKLIDDKKLAAFGWKYQTSIADGIRQTYDYYMNEVRRG
jgi:GDP-L-fucose synthase